MITDPKEPVVLTTVPSEIEATLIADALRERGVQVEIEGEFTSGFRTEVPGDLILMVRQEQLEQANKLMTTLKKH